MDQNKVDMFILNKGSLFPQSLLPYIREHLLNLDNEKWHDVSTLQFKNPIVSLLLSTGCGIYGADRFYIGNTTLGCLKLLLTIFFIVVMVVQSVMSIEDWAYIIFMLAIMSIVVFWYFIDIFLIVNSTKELNYNKLLTILN